MMRALPYLVPIALGSWAFSFALAQEGAKYTIKTGNAAAPKELSEAIQKLLGEQSIQLKDSEGQPICEVWFRKDIPAEAAPEQLKSGVTFREVKQSEILGAIEFHQDWTDYRKTKIKAGVYTMRLGYQPDDGKHTTEYSDFREFAVLIKAPLDTKPSLMEAKALREKSRESLDIPHPAVFMLWPNNQPGKQPELAAKAKNHWVLNSKIPLVVAGKATNASIGIGLTLVGHTPADLGK